MKKFKLLLMLFVFAAVAFSINKVISDTKKADLRKEREQINYKIDNMGYWTSLAEKGIIPYNPDVKPAPAIFKGTKIKAYHVRGGDSPDVPVSSNSQQSENSIVVDFNNDSVLLNSNNSMSYSGYQIYGANYLYSLDVAETWEGSIQGPNGNNWGDPAVCIDNLGRWYVGYISNGGGQAVSYSDNKGQNWTKKTVSNKPGSGYYDMCDKNHLWVDNKPGSPYENYVYDAWTDFGGLYNNEVVLKRSTNRGLTWGPRVALSPGVNAGSHNQGVNLATGPNGEVYAAWAVYDNSLTEKAIGFCKSTNGGENFTTAVRAINNIYGIRNIGVPQNMRVNSFPAMAVDIGDGPYSGNIYIVWANKGVPGTNTGTDFDVYLLRSTDGGTTWDTPIRVNQDTTGTGKKHFFPWIAVDPVTGVVSVIFYDNRNTAANYAEAWCAVSTNGGETWEDFRVSDVEFKPQPVPGTADGYFGDYLGITAYNGKVTPVWTDNRTGKAMAYVSPFEVIVVNDPYDLTAATDQETGIVQLDWSHEQGMGFEYYKILRDSILVDTTSNLEFFDTLQDYAYVNYSVTAVYSNGDESMPAEINTQYGTSVAVFTPDTLLKVMDITDTTGVSYVNVTNEGTLYLVYTYSPLKKNLFDVPQYKPASGGGDEFINRVTIADVDNFSPYDGYMEFNRIPVHVKQRETYEITVRTKNAYQGDKCAVWIDWNNNTEFDEQPVILSANDESDIFRGELTIPENNENEFYKMRIRLVSDNDELVPYGTSKYGETEDYLLVPRGTWLSFAPQHDTVQVNDTSVITFNFNSGNLEAGIYTQYLKFYISDLDTNATNVFVIMNLSDLNVEASASDSAVCKGSNTQLFVNTTGGTGTLSYEWTTLSGDSVSNEQNPVVTIDSNMTFVVAVYDTLEAVKYDTIAIDAYELPEVNIGSDTAFCGQTDTAYIMLDAGTGGSSYLWSTGDTTQTVKLDKEKLVDYGEHEIYVTVTNENGCSQADTVIVNMKDCTAIDEHEQNLSVSTFPNPNTGNFTLTFNSQKQQNVNLKVISMTGAVVYYESDVNVNNNTRKRINLGNVSNGVYTIIVEGDDFVSTHKVVVSR